MGVVGKRLLQESLPDYLVKINRLSTEISVESELLLKTSVHLLLKELADKDWVSPCQLCPQIALATWRVITNDGMKYICTPHHFILDQDNQIRWEEMSSTERARMEAEWRTDQGLNDEPFPNDDYEDISNYFDET